MKTTPKDYINLCVNNVDTAIIKTMLQGGNYIDIDFRMKECSLWRDEDRSAGEIIDDLEKKRVSC